MQKYDVSAKSYLSENLHVIISMWKMDQHQFAALIGLKYATFNSYMNEGTFPRVPTLLVISDVTGIPVDMFLRGQIPIHMIPPQPLREGERNAAVSVVSEPDVMYQPNIGALIDYSALERRIKTIEAELNTLKTKIGNCQ